MTRSGGRGSDSCFSTLTSVFDPCSFVLLIGRWEFFWFLLEED